MSTPNPDSPIPKERGSVTSRQQLPDLGAATQCQPACLSEGERLTGLLTLVEQAGQRFAQLEELEWRTNFGVWALIGALAFLVTSSERPISINHYAIVSLGIVVVVVHIYVLYRINRSDHHWRLWGDYYREQAKSLLGLPYEKLASPGWSSPVPWTMWQWIFVEAGVTAFIEIAVGYLIW